MDIPSWQTSDLPRLWSQVWLGAKGVCELCHVMASLLLGGYFGTGMGRNTTKAVVKVDGTTPNNDKAIHGRLYHRLSRWYNVRSKWCIFSRKHKPRNTGIFKGPEILKLKTHTSGYLKFFQSFGSHRFHLSSRHTHLHFVRHPWIHRTRSAPEQGGILGRGSLKHSGSDSVTVVLFHVLEVGERWFTANNGVYENRYIYNYMYEPSTQMLNVWFMISTEFTLQCLELWGCSTIQNRFFPRCNFHSRVARKAPFGMHQFLKAENTTCKSKYHKQPLNSHRFTKILPISTP